MGKTKWNNFAVSTLLNPITASALALSSQAGDGSLFPSLSADDDYSLVLEDVDLNREIVRVTARAGDNFTIVRGRDGTSARSWPAGTLMEIRPLARDMEMFPQCLSVEVETWDPGSIADGDEEAKDVTVTGAEMGCFVLVASNLDLQDLQLTASVTAADTVTAVLSNSTGGAVDLGEMNLRVQVIKK